jgi:hypothetical protein
VFLSFRANLLSGWNLVLVPLYTYFGYDCYHCLFAFLRIRFDFPIIGLVLLVFMTMAQPASKNLTAFPAVWINLWNIGIHATIVLDCLTLFLWQEAAIVFGMMLAIISVLFLIVVHVTPWFGFLILTFPIPCYRVVIRMLDSLHDWLRACCRRAMRKLRKRQSHAAHVRGCFLEPPRAVAALLDHEFRAPHHCDGLTSILMWVVLSVDIAASAKYSLSQFVGGIILPAPHVPVQVQREDHEGLLLRGDVLLDSGHCR